jgi:hypothetical protein
VRWFLVAFITLSFALRSISLASDQLSLKPVQSVVIDTKKKFQGTKLGGFSGLTIKGNDFYVISDDRGRFGDPRIYRFALSNKNSKPESVQFQLEPKETIFLFKKSKRLRIYDLEALAPFSGGWLVSSEGDWNSKPRVAPEIMLVQNKTIQQKIQIPDEFLPKFNGKQTAGVYNNKAFEGLYYDEPNQRLFLLSESGLVQRKEGDLVYYLLEYSNKGGNFNYQKQSRLDFTEKLDSTNVYNGASELVKVSDNTFLLLTRSVQVALSLQYSNVVWLIKRRSENDPWEIKDKVVINPENDNENLNQNFEGLSIFEFNGIKYLVMVSDNNFNSFEKTVFSFFELEVK